MKTPVFQSGEVIYRADTCGPVHDAAHRGDLEIFAFSRGQYPGKPLPQNTLTGLRSIGFWNSAHEQHWGLDWHRNEGIEIMFLLQGNETYETSSGRWSLNVGDVTLCPPWQFHRVGNPTFGISTC